MDLSVVIVSYKSGGTIETCLATLFANLGGLAVEVWLVDNNSQDATPGLVEEVGLLDENIFLFTEEPDYCLRARRKGWQTWFLPGFAVVHYEGKSTRQVPYLRLSNYYLSKLYFFSKHYSPLQLRLLKALFTVDLLSRRLVRGIQALSGNRHARKTQAFYGRILRAVWSYRRGQAPTGLVKLD